MPPSDSSARRADTEALDQKFAQFSAAANDDIDPNADILMRAEVDEKMLAAVSLPKPITLEVKNGAYVERWARSKSSINLERGDIIAEDLKPSIVLASLAEIDKKVGAQIQPMATIARRYGFGLRMSRGERADSYELQIVRKLIDAPELIGPWKSMKAFLRALALTDGKPTGRLDIVNFFHILQRHGEDCVDAWLGHWHLEASAITTYGRANGARMIVWAPAHQ